MSGYALALIAHLLLFAYWLGGDLGVFYSSYVVADPARSVAERRAAAGILIALDRVPRVCLILMVPVSVSLVTAIGLASWPAAVVAGAWVLAGLWLVLLWRVESTHGALLTRLDGLVRAAVVAGLAMLGVMTLAGSGPVAGAWVGIKLLLFALIIACGLAIRRVFAPFGPAFGRLVAEGSSPEVERIIDASLRRSRPFVIVIWASLIGAAIVGVVKPGF